MLAALQPDSLPMLLLSVAAFALVGIFLMMFGFKAFDIMLTKIDVEKELAENHNIAVAIVVAAVLIGISMIIGHVMIG